MENDIKTVQNISEFFEACNDVNDGFIFAILTDKILCDTWPLKGTLKTDYDGKLVLEIRVFDKEKEHKLFRGDIGKKFKYRLLDDGDAEGKRKASYCRTEESEEEGKQDTDIKDYYDEIQYLDIDTTVDPGQDKEDLTKVKATGGGEYYVPIKAEIKDLEYAVMKVRHYISRYPETGKAYVSDWRCVGLYKSDKGVGKCVRSWEGGE